MQTGESASGGRPPTHLRPGDDPPRDGVQDRARTSADATRWSIATQLAGLPLFAGVPDRDLERVASLVSRRWIPGGYRISMHLDNGPVCYLLVRGVIKVVEDTAAGEEVILSILGVGDVVEEDRRTTGRDRAASMVAIENSVLAVIPRTTLDDCLRVMPALACNLIAMWSDRLQLADDRIQALATTHVEARLARVLLDLGRRLGVRDSGGIRIPFRLTQAELGAMVGASRVRVNHTLGNLRKSGAIVIDSSHLVIVDEDLLYTAAVRPEPSDCRRSKQVY